MHTDKQVLKIFQAQPQWLFELTGLDPPGPCSFQPFVVKALEHQGDGLVIPDDRNQPLTVVEFQFQGDDTIYHRTVREMVSVQIEHGRRTDGGFRDVQGIIFFRYNADDPQTRPWTSVVRAFAFRDVLTALEQERPGHPLTAVFKPVLMTSDAALEREAVQHFRTIQSSDLDESQKQVLADVFVNWLEQRFRMKTKQEIEAMLLGDLPDLEQTQSGKDLIAIGVKKGEEQGIEKGLDEAILLLLKEKHGALPRKVRSAVRDLDAKQARKLLIPLSRCETLDEVQKLLSGDAKS